jgi:hypothetical protein
VIALKYFAIINKKANIIHQLNALAHMSLGLGHQLSDESHHFHDYIDGSGGIHPNISMYPFIIYSSKNSNQIKRIKAELIALECRHTNFLHTMLEGGHEEQVKQTREVDSENLEYIGLCGRSDDESVFALLKKLSLYR